MPVSRATDRPPWLRSVPPPRPSAEEARMRLVESPLNADQLEAKKEKLNKLRSPETGLDHLGRARNSNEFWRRAEGLLNKLFGPDNVVFFVKSGGVYRPRSNTEVAVLLAKWGSGIVWAAGEQAPIRTGIVYVPEINPQGEQKAIYLGTKSGNSLGAGYRLQQAGKISVGTEAEFAVSLDLRGIPAASVAAVPILEHFENRQTVGAIGLLSDREGFLDPPVDFDVLHLIARKMAETVKRLGLLA